jgi:hypothetical protein
MRLKIASTLTAAREILNDYILCTLLSIPSYHAREFISHLIISINISKVGESLKKISTLSHSEKFIKAGENRNIKIFVYDQIRKFISTFTWVVKMREEWKCEVVDRSVTWLENSFWRFCCESHVAMDKRRWLLWVDDEEFYGTKKFYVSFLWAFMSDFLVKNFL